jgi:predicted HNH restriction endonuclease
VAKDQNRRFEVARRRRALRRQAIAYKGGKCQICGYDRSHAAMDFHHTNPMEKDFSISSRMTCFDAIKRELDKTVLVCANCHREIHDGYHPSYLEYPDLNRSMADLVDDEELESRFSNEPLSLDPFKS